VHGGWSGNAWSGTWRPAEPRPLRLTWRRRRRCASRRPPAAACAGLANPDQIAFNGADHPPAGRLHHPRLAAKNGPRWTSAARTGVPLNYLTQFSEAVRQNLRGDMTLGADWALDLRAPATAGAACAGRQACTCSAKAAT
jgi:translocation and assembly module TamB